jgi:hypothetical protein
VKLWYALIALAWALIGAASSPRAAEVDAAAGGELSSLAGIGRFEFSARAASAAEMPKDTSGEWYGIAGAGAMSGALGMMAPPLYASGLIVGGVLLLPGALIMSSYEKRMWKTAVDALSNIDFAGTTSKALQRRARVIPRRSGRTAQVEIVIRAFGLVGERPDSICFIADAQLVAAEDGKDVLREAMRIARGRASDMPPAQCASMARFAQEDGRLVRDTAAEYAEVLAAAAVARIREAAAR